MTRDEPSSTFLRYLRPNLVAESRDHNPGDEARLRVLMIDPRARQAAFVDLLARNPFPFWMEIDEVRTRMESGRLVEIDDPLLPTLRADNALTPAELGERDLRWRIIEPIVNPPWRYDLHTEDRKLMVAERVTDLRESKEKRYARLRGDKVVSYLRLFWCYGQVKNALVPNLAARGGRGKARLVLPDSPKRGRPRDFVEQHGIPGVNLTPEHEAAIMQAYRLFKPQRRTDKQIWKAALEICGEEAIVGGVLRRLPLPAAEAFTLRQFRYTVEKRLDAVQRFKLEKGETLFNQVARPKLGNTMDMAPGPGSVYQIDATVGDIYLRSAASHKDMVGRPVIYLVLDMYSRMIVGYFVALHGPSWETARGALANAFSDKVEYYASIGRPMSRHEVPARGKCRGLMGDRGWDHLCKAAGDAAHELGYKLSNLPPFRCDLKGLVEGSFDVANVEMIAKAPGAWRKREPGETPNVMDGAYTLAEFRSYLGVQIVKHNNTHEILNPPPDWDASLGRAPTPVMLWNHGCAMSGAPDNADDNWIRARMLSRGTAREHREGLKFRGLYFKPSELREDLNVRLSNTTGRRWRPVSIRWHEGTSDWILVPDDEDFLVYVRKDSKTTYKGMTFDEIDFERKLRNRDRLQHADALTMIGVRLDAEIEKLNSEAREAGMDEVRRTRRPKVSKIARKAEVREGRVDAAENMLAVYQSRAALSSAAPDAKAQGTPAAGEEGEQPDEGAKAGQIPRPSTAALPGKLALLKARRNAAPDEGA